MVNMKKRVDEMIPTKNEMIDRDAQTHVVGKRVRPPSFNSETERF